MIVIEVSQTILDVILGIFVKIKKDLILMFNERYVVAQTFREA